MPRLPAGFVVFLFLNRLDEELAAQAQGAGCSCGHEAVRGARGFAAHAHVLAKVVA